MDVQIIPINVEKTDKGLFSINLDTLSMPASFVKKHHYVIHLPPLEIGGNHRHPREEVFLCLSDNVEFHWIDKEGKKHTRQMKEKDKLYLFYVRPHVAHAVVNKSELPATLVEFADSPHYDVEPMDIVS